MPTPPPPDANELAGITEGDEHLDARMDGINVALNRRRLAAFLEEFGEDRDVRDLLALDVFGYAAGLPLSSTGTADSGPLLVERPFRLWEYAWLYKILGLASGQARVLDLGGPATHISVLAAIAGCQVTSIDINPEFVDRAQDVARILRLSSLAPRAGDMRDLSGLPSDSFDCVMSCSVLEHLTSEDQQIALREMARVLKPGGAIGLTFDFGEPAPGQNEYLPPPHDPPRTAQEALHRYVQGGLTVQGNAFCEDPVPRSLFHDQSVSYTVAALFLTKAPGKNLLRPLSRPEGTAWGQLVIEKLPNRLYALCETVREKEDQIRSLSAQVEILEKAANDRLKEMLAKEEILQRLNKRRIFIKWR